MIHSWSYHLQVFFNLGRGRDEVTVYRYLDISQSNITKNSIQFDNYKCRIYVRLKIHKKTPHISPSWASYGVFIVSSKISNMHWTYRLESAAEYEGRDLRHCRKYITCFSATNCSCCQSGLLGTQGSFSGGDCGQPSDKEDWVTPPLTRALALVCERSCMCVRGEVELVQAAWMSARRSAARTLTLRLACMVRMPGSPISDRPHTPKYAWRASVGNRKGTLNCQQ